MASHGRVAPLSTDAAAVVRRALPAAPASLLLSQPPGAALDADRPEKSKRRRVTKVYEDCLAAGFDEACVQEAVRSAFASWGDVDEPSVLDLLCLRDGPLPAKFSAGLRAASTSGSVEVMARAVGAAPPPPPPLSEEEEPGYRVLPPLADADASRDTEADKEDRRRWILSYAEATSSDDSSDEYEQPGRAQPPSSRQTSVPLPQWDERRWSELSEPAEARQLLGAALRASRAEAQAAKAAHDAARQRECGEAIRHIREAMQRLDVSEEECLACAAEEPRPSPLAAEPDDGISLFDDAAPAWTAPSLPQARRAAAAPAPTTRKKVAPTPTRPLEPRAPKALLQELCQRQGWPAPRFERRAGGRLDFSYAALVEHRTFGARRLQLDTFTLPDGSFTASSVEEAQNAAACCALVRLAPEQALDSLMPAHLGALWRRLDVEQAARDRAEQAGERGAAFVDALLSAPLATGVRRLPSVRPGAAASCPPRARRAPRPQADMRAALQRREASAEYADIARLRASLPITAIRVHIAAALRSSDCVIIVGATGCGKTTQVPQFVLDDCSLRGEECSIVCTQPRRVAAISIAERVAYERLEAGPGCPGASTGYQVRLEAAVTADTRLLFCTTGILLRRLHSDPALADTSHLVLDEVHERSLDVDLLLALLRDMPARRAVRSLTPLKLLLMSATVDATLLSAFFGGCPVLTAEGRTFPVETLHLEDVYERLSYLLAPDSPAALRARCSHQRAAAAKGDSKEARLVREGWGDEEAAATLNPAFEAASYASYSARTRTSLGRVDEGVVDYELIETLLCAILDEEAAGAVLIFLPGIREVGSLHARLSSTRRFSGGDSACSLLPLHSGISSAEQRRVFQPTRRGVRKVVIATNIAETSVTIEDVVFVIDSGRQKSVQYKRGVSSLEEEWVSQANARQRQGRAGRVRPGKYFALYTRSRFESFRCGGAILPRLPRPHSLASATPSTTPQPEIQRIALTEAALRIADLGMGSIGHVFSLTPEPPSADAVLRALALLREQGALGEGEELTPLGRRLAMLPCDVSAGRLAILGSLLGCARHALTIAAYLGGKTPFVAPHEEQDAADRVRRALAEPSAQGFAAGQHSDHLVVVDAYEGWRRAMHTGGGRAAADYCRKAYLDPSVLAALHGATLPRLRIVPTDSRTQTRAASWPSCWGRAASSSVPPALRSRRLTTSAPSGTRTRPTRASSRMRCCPLPWRPTLRLAAWRLEAAPPGSTARAPSRSTPPLCCTGCRRWPKRVLSSSSSR